MITPRGPQPSRLGGVILTKQQVLLKLGSSVNIDFQHAQGNNLIMSVQRLVNISRPLMQLGIILLNCSNYRLDRVMVSSI